MWEFWRSRLSKGKTRHRPRGTDDDSPSTARSLGASGNLGLLGSGELVTGPENSTHVYFKDIILPASDESEEEELTEGDNSESGGAEAGTSGGNGGPPMRRAQSSRRTRPPRVDKQKLIIILVGLPGRGKTFLCNKLLCYLNWLGHETRHFNVGQYRRKAKGEDEVQDASFFDHNNTEGMKAREAALYAALDDLDAWLATASAQVAIFDATNSTEHRRQLLRAKFHGKWQYLFIESICNDTQVLEQNYNYKMMYSPDYAGVDTQEQALNDFKARIRKYEEVYETITDRNLHYIKLIDMVTGRGYMDVNRISGYIPGKIVFFLMQICKAGVARVRKIWLTRHGESQYNTLGKIGGNSGLSPRGEMYARMLPDVLVDRVPLTSFGETMPVSVWTSTLARTIQTAQQLPFPKLQWKVLDEIQAGIFDGWTYEQIAEERPDEFDARKKDKLAYRYPSGESYMDVVQRLEPVIIEIERERECVCVVAHQAILRALYGYFTKTPLADIPRLEVPLHTLIELVPKPDGKMAEERLPINVDALPPPLLPSAVRQQAPISDKHRGMGDSMNLDDLATPLTPFTPLMPHTGSFDAAQRRWSPNASQALDIVDSHHHQHGSSGKLSGPGRLASVAEADQVQAAAPSQEAEPPAPGVAVGLVPQVDDLSLPSSPPKLYIPSARTKDEVLGGS